MKDKYYYKIINVTKNEIDFYVSVDLPVKPEKLYEILNLRGCRRVEPTTKEEYEENTEEYVDCIGDDDLCLTNN